MKTKLTPAVQERFIYALSVGSFIKTACTYSGITERTYQKWIKRAANSLKLIDQDETRIQEIDEKERVFVHFYRLTHEQLSAFEIDTLAEIQKDGKPLDKFKLLCQRFQHWRPDHNHAVNVTFNFSEILQAADDVKQLVDGKEIASDCVTVGE